MGRAIGVDSIIRMFGKREEQQSEKSVWDYKMTAVPGRPLAVSFRASPASARQRVAFDGFNSEAIIDMARQNDKDLIPSNVIRRSQPHLSIVMLVLSDTPLRMADVNHHNLMVYGWLWVAFVLTGDRRQVEHRA